MSFKNRGLGRGLEALLVDVSAKEDASVEGCHSEELLTEPRGINDAAKSVAMANDLLLAIRQERRVILAEAVDLKGLMDEIEQKIRDF